MLVVNKYRRNQKEQIERLVDEILPENENGISNAVKLIDGVKPVEERYYPASDKIDQAMQKDLDKSINAYIVKKSQGSRVVVEESVTKAIGCV